MTVTHLFFCRVYVHNKSYKYYHYQWQVAMIHFGELFILERDATIFFISGIIFVDSTILLSCAKIRLSIGLFAFQIHM